MNEVVYNTSISLNRVSIFQFVNRVRFGAPPKDPAQKEVCRILVLSRNRTVPKSNHNTPLTKLLQGSREHRKKGSKKALVCTPESEKAFDDMKATLLRPLSLHVLKSLKFHQQYPAFPIGGQTWRKKLSDVGHVFGFL